MLSFVLLVMSRSFTGAAEVLGGAEHPGTPLALEGALQVPEEAKRTGEVRISDHTHNQKLCIKAFA